MKMSTLERSERRDTHLSEDSVGELVSRASQQISQLVREEMRLAQAEMTQKGKRFGLGGGLFGGAGIVAFVAFLAFAAAAIAGIALALPGWAAALIVAGGLLVIAGLLALLGRTEIGRATPAAPRETIDSVKNDVAEVKARARR